MINKQKALKIIKEKVDGRKSQKATLKHHVVAGVLITTGGFKHIEGKTICKLYKHGNSIMCVDDNYEVRNINELDVIALRKIMWQLISDKEKSEIALDHLYHTIGYLEYYNK